MLVPICNLGRYLSAGSIEDGQAAFCESIRRDAQGSAAPGGGLLSRRTDWLDPPAARPVTRGAALLTFRPWGPREGPAGGRARAAEVASVAQTDGEVTAMQERREQLVERLRTAEQARDLLKELERHLKEKDNPDLERLLTQLDQMAQSLPEVDRIRWFIQSDV